MVASDLAHTSVDGGLSAAQWVRTSYVVDASYEGEVLMAANCSYSFGREAASKYNEALGGVSMNGNAPMTESQNAFEPSVSPFKVANDESSGLLWGVVNAPDPRTNKGAADANMMSFQYRVSRLWRTPALPSVGGPPLCTRQGGLQHSYQSADTSSSIAGSKPHPTALE